jgi:hypothetical protein
MMREVQYSSRFFLGSSPRVPNLCTQAPISSDGGYYLGTISISDDVLSSWRRIDGGGNEKKKTIDSEGILFSLTRILRSSPLSCSHNAPCGRKTGHRTGMGEALGHLCTQRIEMAVRRVIGMDTNSSLLRFRVSARGLAPSGVLEPSATQPHAPHQVGLACHLYRAVEPRPTYTITYAADSQLICITSASTEFSANSRSGGSSAYTPLSSPQPQSHLLLRRLT